MRKSDPIYTSTEDKNNEYKLVIRNIEKANCNINYINNILKYLDLSTQIISNNRYTNSRYVQNNSVSNTNTQHQ